MFAGCVLPVIPLVLWSCGVVTFPLLKKLRLLLVWKNADDLFFSLASRSS